MELRKLNINPSPDYNRIIKVLKRQGEPDRVPLFELFSNIEDQVLNNIEIKPVPFKSKPDENDPVSMQLKKHITYMYNLGYDYINVTADGAGFPQEEHETTVTNEGERSYHKGSDHTMANREDFDKYAWPDISKVDYSIFEKAEKIMPEGMKIISLGSGGVLENVMWLLGYEGISLLLYDDEQLVKDMFEKVAVRIIQYFDNVASIDCVGAVILGDDLGFKTQSLLSPETYRKYLFPWHKKVVDIIQKHGKQAILHACGYSAEIMEDIIDCGWDAKHSFEDAIEPVWEAKAGYGDKIALLGGFDVDKVTRMSEEDIREHAKFLIEKCAPGGGWAFGTGNSVPTYVPVNNFLTMQEQGFTSGIY